MASAAHAAPLPLRDDLAATGIELAGPDVLVTRAPEHGFELIAVPRAGGTARTLLSVPWAAPAWPADVAFSASPERVAVIVEVEKRTGRTVEWRVYSGPPSGPLELVRREPERGRETWMPYIVDVDGGRLLVVDVKGWTDRAVRARLVDTSGTTELQWARRSFAPLAIAGPYVAVAARRPRRLAVVDLATGNERTAIPDPHADLDAVDLAPDGRLVADTAAGIAVAQPGQPLRLLPETDALTWPRFAGATIAMAGDDGRPLLHLPDGSRHALDPPTSVLTDLAADEDGVAWVANGCIRHAPLTGGRIAPPPADPCPTSEIGLYFIADTRLRGRRVRVPVRCVAAASGVCGGTVFGSLGRRVVARGAFSIPVGRERWVPMRLARRAAARFRRDGWGSLVIDARVPGGRVGAGRGASELTVKVRRPR